MDAQYLIQQLGLEKLPHEGGYFRETYRSKAAGEHPWGTGIYYLVTPSEFSALHRLPSEEVFHFYGGDSVEMFQIAPSGEGSCHRIGMDLEAGERPQLVVPGGTWQGTRLVEGGEWALMGCTVVPGFRFDQYEGGEREALLSQFPQHRDRILRLTR